MANIKELEYETGVLVTYHHDLDKMKARKHRKADVKEQRRRRMIYDDFYRGWLPTPFLKTNGGHLIHRGYGSSTKYLKNQSNRQIRRNTRKIDDRMSGYDFHEIVDGDDLDFTDFCYPEDDLMLLQHNEYQKAYDYDFMLFVLMIL